MTTTRLQQRQQRRGAKENETDQSKMLTYGCRNVKKDNAAVDGGGGRGFGPPASETNEAQLPNTKDDGAKASGTPWLRRVVNSATTRMGGPEL